MKIKFKKTDLIYISAILVVAAIEFGGFTSEKANVTGKCDGHNYVDLGLPSGTLWATSNIGAKESTEYGDYFAWGETESKGTYSKDNNTLYPDSILELDATIDAATANWGKRWRTPKITEMNELLSYCFWTWTDNFKLTGVAGEVGYSKINGKMIFFPASGFRIDNGIKYRGQYGFYRSSSRQNRGNNQTLSFYDQDIDCDAHLCWYGLSVRAVVAKGSD